MKTCPKCEKRMQGLNAPEGTFLYHCRYCGTQVTEMIEQGSDGWETNEYVTVPEIIKDQDLTAGPTATVVIS